MVGLFFGTLLLVTGLFRHRSWVWLLAAGLIYGITFYWWQAGVLALILFLGGLLLLLVELYIPGFGIVGLGGGLTTLVGLYSGQGTWTATLGAALVMVLAGLGGALYYFSRGQSLQINTSFILARQLKTSVSPKPQASLEEVEVGQVGVVASDLRPVGKVEFDGQIYEAMSSGQYIAQGQTVQVQALKQDYVLVRKVDEHAQQ